MKREAVRQRLSGPFDRPRRDLLERVAVRVPGVLQRAMAPILRLPPSAPLRRRFLAWVVTRGFSAVNRRDFELNMGVFYDEVSS